MRRHACFRTRPAIAILAGAFLLAVTSAARSQPSVLSPEPLKWSVTSIFEKDDKDDKLIDQPRMNLSGAACVPTTPQFTSCLIANDEKKYAQFFTIEGTSISPRELIRLWDGDGDPDAEGVAYADGYFYVVGSHGRSRRLDKDNDSSYALFRFPVDAKTGKPPFDVSDKKVVGVETSARLRDVIRQDTAPLENGQTLKAFYNKSLTKDGGNNIEAIAVKNGRMHLGFRGPSQNRNAFVLSVDAAAVFTRDQDVKARVTPLTLGENTGIRDLAAVSDGILVLAGPIREEDVPYSLWFWDGVGNNATLIGNLDPKSVPEKAKAEILLLLEDGQTHRRVLVMFDGAENGGPISFRVPR